MAGVAAIGFSSAAHGQVLDAYWAANGNTLDSSGNGNTGTLEGGAGYGPGIQGQAFALNGSNQWMQVNNPNFDVSTGAFTLSGWANFAAYNQNGFGQLPNEIVGQDQGGGNQPKWVMFFDHADGDALGFHVNGPGGSQFLLQSVGGAPALGSWNMYSLTYSAGLVTFYFNGNPLGSQTLTPPVPSVNAPITIGEAEGIGFTNGNLDEIRIYKGAMTGDQVHALYLSTVPEPAPIAILASGGLALVVLRRRRG